MTADDYPAGQGAPVAPAAPDFGPSLHPTRDLVIGAVVGAVALWAVPRMLDFVVGDLFGGGGDSEEYDLEVDG